MAHYSEKPDFPLEVPKDIPPTVVHLVEGEHEVEWHKDRSSLPWPPYSDDKCKLRDGPECEDAGCPSGCKLHVVPGGWRQEAYFFCRCPVVSA